MSIRPNTKTTIKRNDVGTKEHDKQIKRRIRWHDLKKIFFWGAIKPNNKIKKQETTQLCVVLMMPREFSSNYFF